MSQLDELRKEFPEFAGMADHEVVADISRRLGEDPAAIAQELGIQIAEPGFKTGLISQLASYVAGAGRALEDMGAEDLGRGLRQYGEDVQFRNPTTVHSFEQFVENPWQGWREFTGQAFGSVLPMLLPYVGPVARGLGMGGTLAAGTAISAIPAYDAIRRTQEETGQEDIPAAVLGAAATGGLEQLGGIQRALRPALALNSIRQMGSTPMRTFAKHGLRVAGEEGLEEVAQQPVQQLAGGLDPTAPEQIADTAFSGFAGTLGSMPFGAFAGARMGLRHRAAQDFVQRNLLNPEAPTDARLAAVEIQREFLGGDAQAQAWAENMRLGIQADADRARAAQLASGAPLDLLNIQRDLEVFDQYQPAPQQPDVSQTGSIYDTILQNEGALLAMPHQAPAMAPGTPTEPAINRAASIFAALHGRELRPDSQEAVDYAWANEQLKQSMSPAAYQAFIDQLALDRGAQKPRKTKPAPPVVPDAAPVQAAPRTLSESFKAAGGRVSHVAKALDQAKTPEEAVEVVRQWIEKPNIAQSTHKALIELHKQLTGKTYEQYLREQEAAVQPQGAPDVRQSQPGQLVPAGNGQAQGAQPGAAVQQAPAAGQRPAQQDRQGAVSTSAQRAQLAESIIGSLRPEDREVLGFLQQYGDRAFEPLAAKLGISRQAARQRVFGVRDRDGKVRQVGIVDRIANIVAAKGLTMEDVLKAYKPRVYESDEARLGLSPKLNESVHETDVQQEESNVEQTSGTVASPGGSQSNWKDGNSMGENWLRENDPEYGKRSQSAEEPDQEVIPAAQGEKVDQRIEERDAAARAYARAEQWWEIERDGSPAIPKFEDLSDRHQEEVIEAVEHDEADGRLQRRIAAEFNDPSYFSRGKALEGDRALSDDEYNSRGVQRALNQLHANGLMRVLDTARSIFIRPELVGSGADGLFIPHGDGTYSIALSPVLFEPDRALDLAHNLRHETAHALDFIVRLQYSSHPAMEVRLEDGGKVVPVGDVARELFALYQRGTELGRNLEYPFAPQEAKRLEAAEDVQSEMFAQLQAAWTSDYGRAVIQREARLAAEFMRGVNEHAKQVLVSRRQVGAERSEAGRFAFEPREGTRGSQVNRARRHTAFHGTPHAVHESGGFSLEKIGTGEGAQAYGWENRGKSIDAFRESLKTMPNKELDATVEMMKEARDRGDKDAQARWLAAREEQARRRQGQLFRDVQERYGSDDDGTPPMLQNRGRSIENVFVKTNSRAVNNADIDQDTLNIWSAHEGLQEAAPQLTKRVSEYLSDVVGLLKAILVGTYAADPNAFGTYSFTNFVVDGEASYVRGAYAGAVALNKATLPHVVSFRAEHLLLHEVAHVLDGYAGYYSRALLADEVVADEIVDLWEREPERAGVTSSARAFISKMLNYPLAHWQVGDMDDNGMRRELFAQLYAAYVHPLYRPLLAKALPVTYARLGEIHDEIARVSQKVEARWKRGVSRREAEARAERSLVAERGRKDVGFLGETDSDFGSNDDSGRGSFGRPLANRGRSIESIQRETTTRLGDLWAKVKPTLLTLHQIVDQFGDRMAGLKDYVRTLGKMEQRHQEILNRAHGVILDWQKLPTREREQLHQVMQRATMRGIHPDLPFGTGENAHLTDIGEYEALKTRYDALSDSAKATYQAVKKLLGDNWAARRAAFSRTTTAAYQKLIDEAGGDQKKIASLEAERDRLIRDHEQAIADLKGPYFPLLRFGDYLMIARSKELAELQERAENATGSERTALQKRIAAMQRDGAHYVVEAYENRYDAEASALRHQGRGMVARAQLAEEQFRSLQPLAAGAIDKISSYISDQFDKDTAAKMKRLVTELYISSLPEHAALQRQLKRKGIEGATTDMLRAVAKAVEKDAFHLARLEYADELASQLFKVKQEAKKAGIDAQHVYNNLAARLALDFDWKPTPVQSALARISGIWHLGMSPAYLLTNSTQPWMITAPVLAGRFGAGRSFAALRSAWVDAANIIRQSKKGGAFADIRFESVADPQERAMLERIVQHGQIDITQNVDMGLVADGTDPRFLKLQKAFNWINQHIEASNRITTALASYRLARQRGMNHDDAAEFAFKLVVDTQLDYSNANAAYWMKAGAVPLGKLIFQFRKYQQGMLYLLARNAQLAFKGDKDALRALGYLATMQLAFAGAVGIPVVTAPLAALGMFVDDDDEKGDPETQLRNYLTDVMGADAARAFWKGLPTLVGLDVSQRLGMGDLWKPLPFLRLTGRTGRDDVAQLILATLGAPFGMISNAVDSANFFAKGDWGRGIERLLPKMLADPLKAARYANDGLTTRSGNIVVAPEKIDGWDIAFRAAGFAPTVESEHYAAQRAKEDVSGATKERRSNVLAKYAQARLRGDDTAGELEAINRFNADHPGQRISRSDMLQAVESRRRGAKELDAAGVRFTRRERPLRDITRFAY